jgi:hypothetical protein
MIIVLLLIVGTTSVLVTAYASRQAFGTPLDYLTLALAATTVSIVAAFCGYITSHFRGRRISKSKLLRPGKSLPRLERIILRGHAEFDISTLAGIENTVIEVPPKSRVIGAEKIGSTSRLTRLRLEGEKP